MEIRHLRYFVAVAEERHFGRAAERLHIAQPPLSQQIKQLEALVGARLLERTTRRVDLTDAGRLMLERSRQILADLEALELDVREVGRGAAGILRVGYVGSAAHRLMPALVQRARVELPGVRLQMSGSMLTPQLEQGLRENRLDVALLRPPVQDAEIALRTVQEGALVLAVPAGHPLDLGRDRQAPADDDGSHALGAPLTFADLGGREFVSYPQESSLASIVQEAARQAGFRPRVAQRAGETAMVLAFVAAGMGVAVVPEEVRGLAPAGVAFRALADLPRVELAVAVKQGTRNPLIPAFLEVMRRTAAAPADLAGPAPADVAAPRLDPHPVQEDT